MKKYIVKFYNNIDKEVVTFEVTARSMFSAESIAVAEFTRDGGYFDYMTTVEVRA